MGLPIHIVAAVTTNDIVYRTVNSGDYSLSKEVIPTLAPSMDIQVPYNMERILLLSGQNKEDIVNHMHQFEKTGSATVPPDILTNINTRISSFVANDELIKQTMRKCWNENQYLICPHTATAVAYYYSQLEKKRNVKCVCFATASPAKFAEAVLAAGLTPQPTKAVTELESKPTRYIDMPSGADWEAMLRAKIEKISRKS
ncbi:PREDICTED: threonine synthase-like 2 [Priapulus caudatus]|uniref:Threonine synthase-like 2 n=1 Tax=Priapulus caudatus TaxID=37621 RepID=A0ABM1EMI7_PRICU|nr:PREDICTED: threonine synthase-like 2 [Priapulus caudatus]XP_014673408.1 PREDICTED: threonine synthase-like 2 [Priapulus caudatus]